MRNTFAIVLPALALAGCNAYRGLEPIHQPVVSRAEYNFDVATAGDHLAPGEAARLDGWMTSLQVGFGDSVAVDDPSPYHAGVRDDVSRLVAHYGLLLSDASPVTPAPVAPGTARVVVMRAQASVPGCPDFTGEAVPNFDAHTSPNFGCASNRNLAAMVANANDLVRGESGATFIDPATSGKAIDSYRKATPTGAGGLKAESTSGGK